LSLAKTGFFAPEQKVRGLNLADMPKAQLPGRDTGNRMFLGQPHIGFRCAISVPCAI
jgi:hypothetical protein